MSTQLNTKKWLLASFAVFTVIFIFEFVIHGVLLNDLYQQTASVWRPEADIKQLMWLMWVGYAIFTLVFVWIYSKGYETNKGALGQGIRYGLIIGLLTATMRSLGSYATLPVPAVLAVYWFVAGLVVCLGMGITVSLTYRPE